MIFYSGHGNSTHLLLSEYDDDDNKIKGIYPRNKLFFIDSCRGNKSIPAGGLHHGDDEYIHPEKNRGIMNSIYCIFNQITSTN